MGNNTNWNLLPTVYIGDSVSKKVFLFSIRFILFILLLPYFFVKAHRNALIQMHHAYLTQMKVPKALRIQPAFKTKSVNLVFATDSNYVPYLSTALQSILEHASHKTYYDIVILEENVDEYQKIILKSQISSHPRISLRFYSMTDFVNNFGRDTFVCFRHLSVAAFFRLFIPRLFADYKRVLYLDCDVVFLKDVANLFYTKIGHNWIAAAPSTHAILANTPSSFLDRNDYVYKTLKMKSIQNYFFSGGLIYNIPLMNKNFVQEQFFETLRLLKNPIAHDQDILNVVCEGHVHMLDITWNYPYDVVESFYYYNIWRYNSKKVFEMYWEKAHHIKQLHFYTSSKPWDYPNRKLAPYFWYYARKTPFYEQILSSSKAKEVKREIDKPIYTPQVSIVIPTTLETDKDFTASLASALKQKDVLFEIICATNITNKTVANSYVRICKKANASFSMLLNLGIEEARGDYILFLEPGHLLSNENILSKLYQTALTNHTRICGGRTEEKEALVSYVPNENTLFKDKIVDYNDYPTIKGYERFLFERNFLEKNKIRFSENSSLNTTNIFLFDALSSVRYFVPLNQAVINVSTNKTDKWTQNSVLNYLKSVEVLLKRSAKKHLWKLHAYIFADFVKNNTQACRMIEQVTLEEYHQAICRILKSTHLRYVQKIYPEIKNFKRPLQIMRYALKNGNKPKNKTQPQKRLYIFSIHLVEHCNLNCKFCAHFTPLAQKEFISPKAFARNMKRLSQIMEKEVNCIGLMGGEPLLHPQLPKLLKIARKYFPYTNLELITNGVALLQQKELFWNACRKYDISVECTKYPIPLNFDKMAEKAATHQVFFDFYGGTQHIEKTVRHTPLDLTGKQDVSEMFEKCFLANNCCFLWEDKLFTCTIAPNIIHFNRFFNTNIPLTEQDYIDIFGKHSKQDILNFMARPIPFCRFCNVSARKPGFKWERSEKKITEWT